DLDKTRAPGILALDQVAGYTDAVRGGRPAQIDLGATYRCGPQAARCRRGCIGGRGARYTRVGTEVASRVGGPHSVAVSAVCHQPRVVVGRASYRCDLHETRAPGILAFDQIAGYSDIVRGGCPAQIDLVSARGCSRQVARGRRRLGVGWGRGAG